MSAARMLPAAAASRWEGNEPRQPPFLAAANNNTELFFSHYTGMHLLLRKHYIGPTHFTL